MLYDLACCWALATHADSGTPQQLTHPVTCEQTKAGEEKGIVWSSLGKHVFGSHPSVNAVDRLSLLSSLCAWHCAGSRDTSETDIVPPLLAVPPPVAENFTMNKDPLSALVLWTGGNQD